MACDQLHIYLFNHNSAYIETLFSIVGCNGEVIWMTVLWQMYGINSRGHLVTVGRKVITVRPIVMGGYYAKLFINMDSFYYVVNSSMSKPY